MFAAVMCLVYLSDRNSSFLQYCVKNIIHSWQCSNLTWSTRTNVIFGGASTLLESSTPLLHHTVWRVIDNCSQLIVFFHKNKTLRWQNVLPYLWQNNAIYSIDPRKGCSTWRKNIIGMWRCFLNETGNFLGTAHILSCIKILLSVYSMVYSES